ncbi:MAG: helix-turn-helix domain-containing protein [Lachnospiraceae bacterium]
MKQRPITPEVIIETVTEHYNYKVTKDDILGKNRSRDISYPRQICMYLCEKYTGLSLQRSRERCWCWATKIIQRFFSWHFKKD